MKNFYIAYSAQLDGKNWAGVTVVSSNMNIMNLSQCLHGVQTANLCATKKPLKSWRIIGMSVLSVTVQVFSWRA